MNSNQRNNASCDTYQTGRTHPPRSHSGLLAALLVIAILSISLIRSMGLLQLLQLHGLSAPEEGFSPFANLSETEGSHGDVPPPPNASFNGDMSLELENSPDSTDNILQPGGLPLQDIYEKNIDSVVSISCYTPDGTSSGTGVVLSAQGYIVTNCHVLEEAEAVQVLLTNGQKLSAAVVGKDPMTDLAVLYVASQQLQPAAFGDSAVLRVGDAVVAIGDPLGSELRGTMTDGIISAINRNITTGGRTMTLIQTNAALNSGNSGGPLLNCYGQVIGINTMKITDSAGTEGLGFAIPSTTVKEVVDQLVRQGYVSGRPALGIAGEAVDPFYQIYCKYPQGLYITSVIPDSNAAQKGLRPGDILLSLDSQPITSHAQLTQLLFRYQPGDTLTAKIFRAGRLFTLSLTVEEKR